MKNKWLAAVLNIIPGTGYLYLGVRRVFAVLLLLVCPVLVIISMIIDPEWAERIAEQPISVWEITGTILYSSAFMIDAYMEARRLNATKK